MKHWKLVTIGAMTGVAALVGLFGLRAVHGIGRLEDAGASARALEPGVRDLLNGSPTDIGALRANAARVAADLAGARRGLTPVAQLSPIVGWVPGFGPKLRNAREAMTMGEALARASEDLLAGVDLISSKASEGSTQLLEGNRVNENAFASVSEGQPLFRSALARLEIARRSMDRIDIRTLPSDVQPVFASVRQLTPGFETLARTSLASGDAWRPLLGYEGPRTYLIVAQNADELRAVGGFIPAVWLVTFDRGEIAQFQFWDVTELDELGPNHPLPPEALIQTLWAGVWLFRDSTWYPDFPTSAIAIKQLFAVARGDTVDGVIAVNQWALDNLLQALGPLALPDGTPIDAANYLTLLEHRTDAFGRGYIDTVLNAVMDNLRDEQSTSRFLPLLLALRRSLEQKEIMGYFQDPAVQKVFSANGWDGALGDSPGDYLMVVDSNVGFSKVNRNIDQKLTYEVQLHPAGGKARLDVLYTNKSRSPNPDDCSNQAPGRGVTYEQLKNACYWDYLRVYVPEGAGFDASTPFPMPPGALYRLVGFNDIQDTFKIYSESGKRVFAGFLTVGVGMSRGVAFSYSLPPGAVQQQGGDLLYSLRIAKQSGKRDVPVEVVVKAPAGYKIVGASPAGATLGESEARFSLLLDRDANLQVTLKGN